jgi:microcin C transport system ATP-binding protein
MTRDRIADQCALKHGSSSGAERVFTAPEHPYTRDLLAAEPKPNPAPPQPDAPMIVETKALKVWFPIKRGVMRKVVGHIKAVDGVTIEIRKGETLGVVGESGRAGLARHPAAISSDSDRLPGQTAQGLVQTDAAVPPRHADRVPGPVRQLSALSISDIIEEGLWMHQQSSPPPGEQR